MLPVGMFVLAGAGSPFTGGLPAAEASPFPRRCCGEGPAAPDSLGAEAAACFWRTCLVLATGPSWPLDFSLITMPLSAEESTAVLADSSLVVVLSEP